MKRLIFTAIICAAATGVFAQNMGTDSTKASTETKKTKVRIGLDEDGLQFDPKYRKDTITHVEKTYQFLRYRSWKSSNVGFDVLQFGVRFNDNFKIYLSGGFDWTLIRLRDNITILPNQPVLTYKQDDIDFSKNRFSSSYLRIPLSFDFRTKKDSRGNRTHFVFGPDGGFLLNGRVKQISAEYGKQKIDDTYHFTTFRYGAFARVGYGDWGIFAKYYFNDMFENSPEQDGIRNFSFGFTLGF